MSSATESIAALHPPADRLGAYSIHGEDDLARVVALFRLNYDRIAGATVTQSPEQPQEMEP